MQGKHLYLDGAFMIFSTLPFACHLLCVIMLAPTIIIDSIHIYIINDKNHSINTSFPNQNMTHLQTSKNSSSKHKMKNINIKS